MIRNAILGCLTVLLVTPSLAVLNSTQAQNKTFNKTSLKNNSDVSFIQTVVQKVKSFFTYIGSFFPTFTSCDFSNQPVLSCYNSHQVLRCLPSNLGIVTNCVGCFRYCRSGRCSRIPPKIIYSRKSIINATLLPNTTITRNTSLDHELTTDIGNNLIPHTTSNNTFLDY